MTFAQIKKNVSHSNSLAFTENWKDHARMQKSMCIIISTKHKDFNSRPVLAAAHEDQWGAFQWTQIHQSSSPMRASSKMWINWVKLSWSLIQEFNVLSLQNLSVGGIFIYFFIMNLNLSDPDHMKSKSELFSGEVFSQIIEQLKTSVTWQIFNSSFPCNNISRTYPKYNDSSLLKFPFWLSLLVHSFSTSFLLWNIYFLQFCLYNFIVFLYFSSWFTLPL